MRRQNGFTLIELLLYVAIVGILLGGLTSFFASSLSTRIKNQSISEVDQQGQFVLSLIAQAIRNADSITSPTIGTSSSSLTLAMATAGINPTIFNLSGTTLQVKEGVAAAVSLTNSRVQVTNFTVKNLSRPSTSGTLQVNITLSTINTSGRNEYDYQKTFTTSASLR